MTNQIPLADRIQYTFLAPRRLGEAMRGDPRWLDAILVSTVIAVLAVLTVPAEVFVAEMSDPVNRRGEAVEVTSSVEAIVTWGRALSMLATLATHPVIILAMAALLTGIFSVLGRGHGSFREFLGVVSHGMLIPALGTVISIFVRTVVGRPDGGSLLSVTPESAGSFITAMLVSVDPFILWMLVVMGIAIAPIDRKRSGGIIATVLIGLYIAFITGTTALVRGALA